MSEPTVYSYLEGNVTPSPTASNPNHYTLSGITPQQAETRFRYTGQQYLSQLGLYYYKARFYSPMLGWFPQTDLNGYADDTNPSAAAGKRNANSWGPGCQLCNELLSGGEKA